MIGFGCVWCETLQESRRHFRFGLWTYIFDKMAHHVKEYLIIGVKNDKSLDGAGKSELKVLSGLSSLLSKVATVHRFDIPDLRVGTLGKLMTVADLMQKVDSSLEGCVKRIEKQYEDLTTKKNRAPLCVDGVEPGEYIEAFPWNAARYPIQRALDETVRTIVASTTKMENELREAVSFLQEVKQKAVAIERASEANFVTANLDEALTPHIKPEMIRDSPYLRTCVLVVSKNNETRLTETYEQIGSELVGYGPEKNRESVKGSPVVPGSLIKVVSDKSHSFFLITILSKFYEEFKVAAQNLAIVRDYDYAESYEKQQRKLFNQDEITEVEKANIEVEGAVQNLRDWCTTHFGDAFITWLHVKAIRVFVESILRYGLPANFSAVVIKPLKKGYESKIRHELQKKYQELDSSGFMSMQADEIKAGGEQVYPYVSYSVTLEA